LYSKSVRIILDIRYPDITKKISTPTYPPENNLIFAWYKMIDITAIALNPSISGI
jgi:hypothetical protein